MTRAEVNALRCRRYFAVTVVSNEYSIHVPRGMEGPECAATRRRLGSRSFQVRLLRAARGVARRYRSLRQVRPTLAR